MMKRNSLHLMPYFISFIPSSPLFSTNQPTSFRPYWALCTTFIRGLHLHNAQLACPQSRVSKERDVPLTLCSGKNWNRKSRRPFVPGEKKILSLCPTRPDCPMPLDTLPQSHYPQKQNVAFENTFCHILFLNQPNKFLPSLLGFLHHIYSCKKIATLRLVGYLRGSLHSIFRWPLLVRHGGVNAAPWPT